MASMDVLGRARILMLRNLDVESVIMELGSHGVDVRTNMGPASDLVSLVTEQAKQLSLPAPLLATKLFCERLKDVGKGGMRQQVDSVATAAAQDSVLQLGNCLQEMKLIDYRCLVETIQKEFSGIGLTVVWRLAKANLINVKDLISGSSEWLIEMASEAISKELSDCLTMEDPPEFRNQLVEDFVSVISEALSNGKDDDQSWLLEATARKILLSVIKGSFTDATVQSDSFYSVLSAVSLNSSAKERVYKMILHHYMFQPPLTSILECFPDQEKFQYNSLPQHTTKLFDELTVGLGSALTWTINSRILQQNREVNWRTVLSFISCFVHCHSDTVDLKGLIRELADSALSEATHPDKKSYVLYGAMAIARQAGLEGSHIFQTYIDWFKQTFGEFPRSLIQKKKNLEFLLRCLTGSIPYEPPYCLQVHLHHPPRRLPNCHSMVTDYLDLVRARLDDLNEPLAIVSSNPDSPGGGGLSELALADEEVKEVLEAYEANNCQTIPSKVLEMSIFNKPYYVGRFLRSLLSPRPTTATPDARAELISALANMDKIPPKHYLKYQEECRRLDNKEKVPCADDFLFRLFEPLVNELQRMVRHSNDEEAQFKAVLSRLSHSLSSVIKDASMHFSLKPNPSVEEDAALDLMSPGLQEWQIEMINHIISSLFECILKLYSQLVNSDKPFSHFQCIVLCVGMLSGHKALHKTLLIRLWELIHLQATDLLDEHLLSLAVLMAELYLVHIPYSSISVKPCCLLFNESKVLKIESSSEYASFLLSHLTHHTTNNMITTGKILCHFFQHLSITGREDLAECSFEDDNVPTSLGQHLLKLKFFQERIEFFQNNKASSSKRSKSELIALLKMMNEVFGTLKLPNFSTSSSSQDDLSVKLQLDFMIHSPEDFYTPLERHEFRRLLVSKAGNDSFKALFVCLVLLKEAEEAWCPSCSSNHKDVFHNLTSVAWNEGIQLLLELSFGLSCSTEDLEPPFSFLLSEQLLPLNDSIVKKVRVATLVNCILVLPPYLFFSPSVTAASSKHSLTKCAEILKILFDPANSHGLLSLNLTYHLFKGFVQLLSVSSEWSEHLGDFCDYSPLFLASVLVWWNELSNCLTVNNDLVTMDIIRVLNEAAYHLRGGTLYSSPFLLSHCEAASLGTFGLFAHSKLKGMPFSQFIQKLTAASPPTQLDWNKKFFLLVADCCVSEIIVSSSILHHVAMNNLKHTEDNVFIEVLKYIFSIEPWQWIVLLNDELLKRCEQEHSLSLKQQLELLRDGLPERSTGCCYLALLVILNSCEQAVLRKLLKEPGFLIAFFEAHKFLMNGGVSLDILDSSRPGYEYQIFSVDFIKSCSSLAHFIVKNLSTSIIEKYLPFCHRGLQEYIEQVHL